MNSTDTPAVTMTQAGFVEGMRRTLPILPSITFYSLAFGAAAAQTSMSLLEATLTSFMVFAGAAQLVALELWREHWTLTSLFGIALIVGTVNSRMILMGASLHRWVGGLPPGQLWPMAFFFTDATWIIGERYRAEGGRDAGVVFGSGVLLWALWWLVTIPGYLISSLVPDPKKFGLDLVMPIFFVLMIVPVWKGRHDLAPWGIAALVAVAVWWLVPGYAFIVTGALAGALTAAFLPERADA